MSYSFLRTQNLPVARYKPGPSYPGASHAALPERDRFRPLRRVGAVAALAACLAAVAAMFRPAPPLSAPLPRPTAPSAAVPAAPTRHWDAQLEASPRKGQYVRFFRMKATAYAPINTRMEGGRYTSTLRDGRAAHGVAVDPELIPLGSQLWIPGYGHAVADDIGGAIHGHHVDVRVQIPGHMDRWGVRPVRVYVLQEPPAATHH